VRQLDPLGSWRRTHYCGELRPTHTGMEVTLCGWVHRLRDHGGVIFIDVRDRTGLAQVVCNPALAPTVHDRAGGLHSEYVIAVHGRVERRGEEAINPKLPTGEVELLATDMRLLNTAVTPPFPIEDDIAVDEAVRLRHRIHDLRRPCMQQRLALRHHLLQSVRATCTAAGLYEIETPLLGRATPEGARDFLVPSRTYPGSFYALPQSPQLMKQLLMMAGFDGYFQLARCFRDEDQRADRQLEFTQIDLEMSFVGVDEVLQLLEEITVRAFRDVRGIELARPFRRCTYAEVMARYGSDRPDTRIGLELTDLTDLVAASTFQVFTQTVRQGGMVRALAIPDADAVSRSELDRLVDLSRQWGAKGLAWVRVTAEGAWQSPIAKYLSEAEQQQIAARVGLRPGHLLLCVADRAVVANDVLGRLRVDLGTRLGRRSAHSWDTLFVVNFPLFEETESGAFTYMHMPFVAPLEEDMALLSSAPAQVRGTHYDLVINGVEMGSGSLRNHRADVQLQILEVLGYSAAEARRQFGFLFEALDAGAPPHGGFAFGFDRLCLLLAGGESLRDVIAFPKTQRASDLLLGAPSAVEPQQLRDLQLRLA
jgi:aspartyl-tRNA synthetase